MVTRAFHLPVARELLRAEVSDHIEVMRRGLRTLHRGQHNPAAVEAVQRAAGLLATLSDLIGADEARTLATAIRTTAVTCLDSNRFTAYVWVLTLARACDRLAALMLAEGTVAEPEAETRLRKRYGA